MKGEKTVKEPPCDEPGDEQPTQYAVERIIPKRDIADGTTELGSVDNDRIQSALDEQGTVVIPPGVYWIDCTQPLRPRSNSYMQIEPGAIFRALPHGKQRSQMILIENVNNVRVTGGQFFGERDEHDFSDTSGSGTHEWNHCVAVYSATAVTLEKMQIQDFTGDAMSVGGGGAGTKPPSVDVVLSQIVGTNCYRQGLSVTNMKTLRVYDCQFTKTNGTSPECGIDIEPERGQVAEDIQIVGCYLATNDKFGLNILARTGTTNPGGIIRNVLVTECNIESNKSNGAYAHNVQGLTVRNNRIASNSATGFVFSHSATTASYEVNESGFNYARSPLSKPRVPFTQTGWSSKVERDVILRSSVKDPLKTNRYI
jgi:hypothetical protein